ncbi:uncharacterized protein LOC136088443 [Hydra vulgaris]|uniref:DNA-directed RNA polymerase subunit n=1 Tax=Hydra vulgaris TaxID=6087 RepID=A0ABM4D1T9_HYDVU
MAGNSLIQYVGFNISGDEEHKKNSYTSINSYELFSAAGEPIQGGVYDLRLGTTDHKQLCLTCLNASTETTNKRCPRKNCSAVHPKIIRDEEDHFTFWAEPPTASSDKKQRTNAEKLYPDTIRAIFERISDNAVEALGRTTHPRKLIVREIVIPPNTIRPGVKSFSGAGSSYHDSTNLLQHLVKRNSQLPERLPETMGPLGPGGIVEGDLDRAVQNLQQIYYDLIMGSSSTSVTQGNNGRRGLVVGARPVHSFLRNLPRKEGRVRANLLGKRVFYISRSTISGNMSFRIDEVGIPLEFARTLQVKEVVQEYNRDWLMTFFLNGRRQYPGCTHLVRRATGEIHEVSGLRDFRLEVGDAIFRDVVNGDVAFFNRQPTLERSSIGVHKVIVIQDPSIHTFQMNVLACEWYNADFDGDQTNLWVAREPGARAEAMIMSGVANWFISTKTSGPVNGEVQDSTVGCYELTRSSVRMDKYHAMSLFANTGTEPPRFDLKPADHIYTGRDIVSMLFNQTPINYNRQPSSYSDVYAPFIAYDKSKTLTVIEHGQLVRGVLDKKAIGANASGGVFHLISREYGSQRALDMIFALQQVALQFLLYRGFTVGTADLLPTSEAFEQIYSLVSSVCLESQVITARLLRGEIVPPIDSNVHEFYERMQINALKIPEAEILRWVLSSIRSATNEFFRMIACGSKGNNPNLIHVSGAIGQTTINGERLAESFLFRRTSPYHQRFSMDPAAYGFVANSYISGMKSFEFIAQAMNSRFDLINKALSTATTGYFMRKGVMNNQSSMTDNFRRVMKNLKIVQMLYGEDGLDPRKLEKVEFRTILISDAKLAEFANISDSKSEVVAKAFARIREDRNLYRHIFSSIESANFDQSFSTEMLMPVNIRRIVDGVFIAAKNTPNPTSTVAAIDARIARVNNLCDRLPYVLVNEIQERRGTPVSLHKITATLLFCILIRSELNPRVLARLSDEQLSFIIDNIRQRYSLSMIDYGTAVGIQAAQAISQPLTQYMLDSHHRSVAGGTSKSGISRVGEIYNPRDVSLEQSSAMLLPLRPEILGDANGAFAVAQEIANKIEYVTLQRFVRRYDILLEPCKELIYPPYAKDAQWIEEFERSHPLIRPPGDLTNWCFRFVLDKSALVLKAIELELIVRRLRARHSGFYIVHTPEAVPEIIIRIWHRAGQFKRGDDDEVRAILKDALDTPIRGIRGILRANAQKITRMTTAADGSFVKEDRLAIATTGTNLYHALLHSAIDTTSAISNSIGDTIRLFGIEAGRMKIISETRTCMADNTPNLRHLFLYADEMTRTGRVTSIERGGLNHREHNNVLLRMAYGDPICVVTDATLSNMRNRIYGIAAPQLLGSIPQIGTLYNGVIIDEEFVQKNIKSVDSILDEI